MGQVQYWKGAVLFVDGQVAMDPACCCPTEEPPVDDTCQCLTNTDELVISSVPDPCGSSFYCNLNTLNGAVPPNRWGMFSIWEDNCQWLMFFGVGGAFPDGVGVYLRYKVSTKTWYSAVRFRAWTGIWYGAIYGTGETRDNTGNPCEDWQATYEVGSILCDDDSKHLVGAYELPGANDEDSGADCSECVGFFVWGP